MRVHWLSCIVDLLVACPPDVFLRLFSSPLFSSRLFHTPLAPKPVCGSADFPFAARYNLRLRVRSRQLNSGELDVTPMCLASTMTTSRSCGVETRHTRTLTTLQNPPYNMYRVGANAHWARRVNLRSVFSKQECTSHCLMSHDTHYSSYMKPESLSRHSQSVT